MGGGSPCLPDVYLTDRGSRTCFIVAPPAEVRAPRWGTDRGVAAPQPSHEPPENQVGARRARGEASRCKGGWWRSVPGRSSASRRHAARAAPGAAGTRRTGTPEGEGARAEMPGCWGTSARWSVRVAAPVTTRPAAHRGTSSPSFATSSSTPPETRPPIRTSRTLLTTSTTTATLRPATSAPGTITPSWPASSAPTGLPSTPAIRRRAP
jgi:hypothetical protein